MLSSTQCDDDDDDGGGFAADDTNGDVGGDSCGVCAIELIQKYNRSSGKNV